MTAHGGSDEAPEGEELELHEAKRVLANPRFLALFLSQILTQVGGNMVLFGLTIQVYGLTRSSTSVSILLLTFLVPAVIFGAIAGVYVDRFDRRMMLIVTNAARALAFLVLVFVDDQLVVLYLVTILVATLTTFFAPAEVAMIPQVVARSQLTTANGIFIFTLQASFVLGFAILGPLANNLLGTQLLIAVVAGCYGAAAAFCWILPPSHPDRGSNRPGEALGAANRAVAATFAQLREGLSYIGQNRNIFWSLAYLAITASLVGVLGVLGPDFAVKVLNLQEDDFVIVVLPLGVGLVLGILLLNAYGKYVSRQRTIEAGLITLAAALLVLGLAQRVGGPLIGPVISLLTVVIAVAFVAGVAYALVAVPAQTALQEELPPEVRGRVFGVLNMLVSVASFLPIIVVGPVADLVGTPAVIVASALVIGATGAVSIVRVHPPRRLRSLRGIRRAPVDPLTVTSTQALTTPVQLHYLDESERDVGGGGGFAVVIATPVEPGRAGPVSGRGDSSEGAPPADAPRS